MIHELEVEQGLYQGKGNAIFVVKINLGNINDMRSPKLEVNLGLD